MILCLWEKLFRKIRAIVKKEMDEAGANEVQFGFGHLLVFGANLDEL